MSSKPTSIPDSSWQVRFVALLREHATKDAAHDLEHIHRVVTNAQRISLTEGADWLVVMPAAWLHDCVVISKTSPDRKRASVLAAQQAIAWLVKYDWPHGKLDEISHAIEAHSFTAGIPPRTIEAQVLQDADRLDALGAVGLSRTLMLGGELQRVLYDPTDPFCQTRKPNDSVFTLDHLYCKLLTLEATMQTLTGKREAHQRTKFLQQFLRQLQDEIT
ncbi:MAG: HD domain-containing protein [Akkermansiaceae bacterium]|nr:HD domain-containing protein [Akkermansiaceae bacterium]